MSYKVHAEYMEWITDPEDPEVKAEAEHRKRAGIKPPPIPLVPPVAVRPESVAADYEASYRQLVERFTDSRVTVPRESSPQMRGRRWVTDTAEIDRILEQL